MPNLYLDRKLAEHEQYRADAQGILDNASTEGRDVTKEEREAVDALFRQMNDCDSQIKPLQEQETRLAERDARLAQTQRAVAQRRDQGAIDPAGQLERYRGKVGNFLADWGLKGRDPQAAQRISRALAEYRVVADQKLADNPGVVPQPIVGDVINNISALRPFIDSVTSRPMPSGGSSFDRPRITQHTTVALQATEKTQLSSTKMTLDKLNVAKKTFGGTLDISYQDVEWTDPAILAIVVNDLQTVYAKETDNYAADLLVTSATGTFVLGASPASGAVRAAVLNASNQIAANVGIYPDTVWMAPDVQAQLGAIVETGSAGLPSFPGISQVGSGGELMGLRAVTDANFAAGTMLIGASSYVEHYEQAGSLLSVQEPTILGYTVAFYGYVADVLLHTGAVLKRSLT